MRRSSLGQRLYDAEVAPPHRRPALPHRHRRARAPAPKWRGNRYLLDGQLTFHGVTRPAQGTVNVEALSDRRLMITGEQSFDIRDFAILSPTVLMLRIYPDVQVRLHAEAELEEVV